MVQNVKQVRENPPPESQSLLQQQYHRFTMWKAALLTTGLLIALVDRVRCTEDHPSFYGVKLCGREFIRAVIFTCGGSRWRRGMANQGKCCLRPNLIFMTAYYQTSHEFHPAVVEDLLGEEAFDPWPTNALPQYGHEQNPAESQVWKDRTGNVVPLADGYSRSARSAISEDVLEALRSADRKGRDAVVGLSNACCKWGCSKSEISSLC